MRGIANSSPEDPPHRATWVEVGELLGISASAARARVRRCRVAAAKRAGFDELSTPEAAHVLTITVSQLTGFVYKGRLRRTEAGTIPLIAIERLANELDWNPSARPRASVL